MNWKHIGRTLVCLLLVCCLIFNFATMPAKAALLADDLVLLGIIGAAILLLGGVAFNGPTQDDFRSIGQSFSNALDSAVKTDEDQIIITAVRQDLIEQARQGMNYNKPPRIPMNSFDFWVNAAILAWINSWLNGENAIEQQATDRNGNLIMANGQFVAAGETFNMPVHPNPSFGYANATCCVTNTDCYVYRCFYHTCDEGTDGVCRFYAVLYAPGDVTFQTSRYLCSSRQYSSVDQVEVDGQVYSWCLIILETLRGTTNICDGSFGAHELGAVRLEGHTGITDGTIAAALIGGELIPDTTNKTARYPDLLTGGIKDYLDNGGSTQDIVLPDIDLSGIMQNGETLDEAVSGSMSDVANGSETWQEYVDAVTPDGDITTQEGNEITDTGVSEDFSLWGLLKRMADYLLNGLKKLLWAPIEWLGNMLLEGIKALFVPSQDYISEKVAALTAQYSFAQNMVDAGESLQLLLGTVEPQIPIIYVDLGASEGSFDYGGKIPFVDLTWYAKYKSGVDAILAAFLWLWFVWRTIVILPGTISGQSGLVGAGSVGYFHGYRIGSSNAGRIGTSNALVRRE